MWAQKTKKPVTTSKKKKKEKQIDCVCKIKKVGKDLVFTMSDGSIDKIILTTKYMQLKKDKLYEEAAVEWKSGGVWNGNNGLLMRNLLKRLYNVKTQHLTGPFKIDIDNEGHGTKTLHEFLKIVLGMGKFEKEYVPKGEFF